MWKSPEKNKCTVRSTHYVIYRFFIKAANDLLDKVEKAILECLSAAESFESYHSIRNFYCTAFRY